MISCNKYESVLLSFLPVITLIILTSIFISSAVFHSSFSALIWCLWTIIITMQYLFMFMDSESCLNFCCFSPDLRSLPCHVLFCGGDTSTIYKVYYDCLINFSAVANLCRAYFKYDNNKLRSYLSRYTLVGHIIFSNGFLITVGHFLKLLLMFYRNDVWW